MSSNQRTYGRKRRDQASEKFDELFSDHCLKKPITIEIPVSVSTIKKSRISDNDPKVKNKNGNSGPIVTIKSIKTEHKISSGDGTLKLSQASMKKSINHSKYIISGNVAKTETSRPYLYNSIAKSKYDILFKKNEKNASDKFDALFGDEIKKTVSDNKKSPKESSNNSSYNDLFGFPESPPSDVDKLIPMDVDTKVKSEERNSVTAINIEKVSCFPPKSPKTFSGIAGASMKTIGGKVVLNIHKKMKSPTYLPPSPTKTANNFPAFEETTVISEKLPPKGDHCIAKKIKPVSTNSKIINPLFPKTASDLKSNIETKLKLAPVTIFSTNTIDTSRSRSPTANMAKNISSATFSKQSKFSKPTYSSSRQTSTSKLSYNSRPWIEDSEDLVSSGNDSISSSQPDSYDFGSEETPSKLVRSVTWPDRVGESIVTSLKCNRSAKEYFTVVKHVKNYQNCLEEGEAKEFEDEVNYLLEGMQSSQPLSVRCLSITNLASKCQQHNFRLYVRAHNIADKIFSNLDDAKSNTALALSTAALLFMLSRDRQMEINKPTLQLLLRLLDPLDKDDPESESLKPKVNHKSNEQTNSRYKFFKSKDKANPADDSLKVNADSVTKIKQMVEASGDHLLKADDVSVKRLSSEALLRFTARRTVEWFREEVRSKGGLDHIISLIKVQVDSLDTLVKDENINQNENFTPKMTLCLLERLMKVLENVIVNSPRNAMYLVTYQRALLLKKLARLMRLCKSWLPGRSSTSICKETDTASSSYASVDTYTVLHNTILQIIKLLVNVSNDNEWVSSRVGEQDMMLENIVECILTTPVMLKEEHRYELILLSLSLLVNLVESSAKNRIALMKLNTSSVPHSSGNAANIPVVQALINLFKEREAAARENEILGEIGVKRAAEARKMTNASSSSSQSENSLSNSLSKNVYQSNEHDGHWVETEDGMEWVPSEHVDDTLSGSQGSCRSGVSTKNPESNLTAEEKTEMRETLDKANKHMEDSIVASYAALVLGCLMHGNRANSSIIRTYLSDESGFSSMTRMLKKFLSFMSLTAGMSTKGEKTLTQIIETVEEENASHTSVDKNS